MREQLSLGSALRKARDRFHTVPVWLLDRSSLSRHTEIPEGLRQPFGSSGVLRAETLS